MFEIAEDEFDVSFFKEEGFTRHRCVSCGSHFWSKSPDQQTCGEVPCQPYTFIGNPPTNRSYDSRQMRTKFLSFFTERGHAPVKPYPIVARWRDDVYLVGASIYDFQPYVTEGTMPPPANPLVISQPSVRFTDIEQVGPTAGRHLTIFEMGGHHAFNYPNKEIYWKDQTIRYHHQFLVDLLGVPAKAVTYKEHFWSGGGNAGPDLEGIVGGMEISTLVFMQYKVEGEKLTPTKVKTVDTGYGMERWAWLSQGSPSGFHAVYGPILKLVFDLAKLDIPETILNSTAKAAGIHYSSDKNWRDMANKWISEQTGQEVEKVRDSVAQLEAAYALTDHSKAICFLLAEGIVPSNVGEGYLARLIIRRAARLARQLGILDSLPELVEAQVKHWCPDFRTLLEMRHEVMEGLRVETKKYQDTLARGSEVVVRLSKELANKGVRRISTDQLVQLYDSQGLPPEIVREGAEKVGVQVDIPENFLSLVAGRHSKPVTEAQAQTTGDLDQKLKGLSATRTLYYEDPYKTSFTAKIVARPTETSLVLDQTCFYPHGGGQPGDHGKISVAQAEAHVVDVQKFGDTIIHFLDKPVSAETELAEGEIDWSRRQSLMRHHTSTHALLGAARRVLGEHIWQAGAQKDVETSRLDITHYRPITGKEKDSIERLVNQLILRNVLVQATWLPREKAEAKYGFRLYQGGAVPGAKIRVVKIRGWDVEACGGTHCTRTGELGLFKIVRIERLRDGVERIIFSAGEASLSQVKHQQEILTTASELLATTPDRLADAVKSLIAERDGMAKELEKTRAKTLDSRVKELGKRSKPLGPVRLLSAKLARRKGIEVVNLANRLKETSPEIVVVLFEVSDRVQVVVAAGDTAVASGVNSGDLVSQLSRMVGGGGGGRPYFATGGGSMREKVDDAMKMIEEILTVQLGLGIAEKVG